MLGHRDSAAWLAIALVLSGGALAWPFTVDDAFIVARYAHQLTHGAGYAFNAGVRSDGVTGPLWLLPLMVGEVLRLSPLVCAKALDLACAALAAALVTRRAGRQRWGVALLVGTNAAYVPWAVGGLGGGLASLLLVLALPAQDSPSRRARALWSGVAVGLLAWLRPEACAAGMVLLAGQPRGRRRDAWAVFVLLVAGVALFRLALFGHVLPMALAAKPSFVAAGLSYLARGALIAFGAVGIAPVFWVVRRGDSAARVRAVAVLVHGLAVVLVGGDWMPGFRLLAVVVPLYALAWADAWEMLGLARRRQAYAAGAVACVISGVFLVLELPPLRASGDARDVRGAQLAEDLRRLSGPVAVVDVGYLGYRSGVDVLDLGGVTDAVVANSPGGHLDKHIDWAYVDRVAPAAILLHSSTAPGVDERGNLTDLAGYPVERRLAASAFIRARYRVARVYPYAPLYRYVLLVRR